MPRALFWAQWTYDGSLVPNEEKELIKVISATGRRVKTTTAPSWSWISVRDPCLFLGPYRDAISIQAFPLDLKWIWDDWPDYITDTAYDREQRSLTFYWEHVASASRCQSSNELTFKPRPGRVLRGDNSVSLIQDDQDEDLSLAGDIICLAFAIGTHEVWTRDDNAAEIDDNLMAIRNRLYAEGGSDAVYDWLGPNRLKCNEHVLGLAFVPEPGGQRGFRRVGLFHAKGAACPGHRYCDWNGPRLAASQVREQFFVKDLKQIFEEKADIVIV